MAHDDTPIRPAATVLLVRDGADGLEVLMQRRAATMVFASGTYVFPGGRVDPEDGEGPAGYVAAAVRECREEADLVVDAADLVWIAHWITPRGEPRRFDTRFFLAAAPHGQEAVHDGNEAVDTVWAQPARALEQWKAKEWAMLPPTLWCLGELSRYSTVADALTWAHSIGTPPEVRVRAKRTPEGKVIGFSLPTDPDYDDWDD